MLASAQWIAWVKVEPLVISEPTVAPAPVLAK